MDLADLTLAVFQPLVGDAFVLDGGDRGPLDFTLESARQLGEQPGGREPFGLLFRGPGRPSLPQATYPLKHARLGAIEIFIVPVAQNATGVLYQAIFT